MRNTTAIVGSALFFVIAPFLAGAIIPWWITRWEFRPAFFDLGLMRAIGVLLIVAGVPGVVDSFARFALQGLGTPAPVAPPQRLVVTGLYIDTCEIRCTFRSSRSSAARRSSSGIGASSSTVLCSAWPATCSLSCARGARAAAVIWCRV